MTNSNSESAIVFSDKVIERLKTLGEYTIPIADINGNLVTPKDVVEKGIEIYPSMFKSPDSRVAEARLKEKYNRGMLVNIKVLGNEYSPEDQIKEIEEKSLIGHTFMLAEYTYMKAILDL